MANILFNDGSSEQIVTKFLVEIGGNLVTVPDSEMSTVHCLSDDEYQEGVYNIQFFDYLTKIGIAGVTGVRTLRDEPYHRTIHGVNGSVLGYIHILYFTLQRCIGVDAYLTHSASGLVVSSLGLIDMSETSQHVKYQKMNATDLLNMDLVRECMFQILASGQGWLESMDMHSFHVSISAPNRNDINSQVVRKVDHLEKGKAK